MMRNILFVFILLIVSKSFAQLDSIQKLKVVNLSSAKLQKHSKGFKVLALSDSIILKNTESFTTLLRFNTPIYIKEYGAGGTSTASFRGTSASNTAVIWNGININSINNGQTGFNALTVNLFDNIDVRSGGGSIEFGSGAIGGTIHLNDQLRFGNHIDNQLVASGGSYDTYNNLYKFSFGSERIAAKFGASYNQSENDYDWLGTDGLKNENGAYNNLSFSLGFGYKLNKFSKLSVFSSKFNGSREFSGTLPNPSAAKEKYKDYNFRNLIAYNYRKNEFAHDVRFAYLTQEYRYFADKNVDFYNYGKSKTFLLKYDFSFQILDNSSIESITELESVFGSTDEIIEKNRKQFSQSIIYNLSFENIASINAKIRKDFNSDYNVPFVFALGAELTPLKNTFIRVNGSKNYRVPTYNDLYWPALGNADLIPESSLQSEFGVGYKTKQVKLDVGVYYINSKDKIVWTPGGDSERPGIWTPINVAEAVNKGIEFTAAVNKAIGKHLFNFNLNYSYTIAKDKSTNNYLTYVPKHLANGSVGYSYKRFSAFYQHLFTGEVYTTTDNLDNYTVPYYNVGNVGVNYNIIKTNNNQLGLGVKVNNVFNKEYQVLPSRPMPNRNFNININFKF
ncbi:iron complex outermembrane recepter protein [Lutibacter agarilyticus]|uniref:Iron complex outermembrane recepter protein n=1 Tax=Lutibacter agarilyticus TaxID=1109740 RepID=A0A238VFC5_9FLAO|nr:TonB-dependent receptor [Lutibacter agarilyticus]SNR32864.1 iron complex outermembrane recepter protein [Lutibacter agarilyticus]